MTNQFGLIKLSVLLAIVGAVLLASPPILVSSAQRRVDTALGDVERALRSMPSARVVTRAADGIPSFINGDLARVETVIDRQTEDSFRSALARIAPAFRVNADNLTLVSVQQDSLKSTHARYRQTKNGLSVVGGDLVMHVNDKGVVYAANGTARDDVDIDVTPSISAEACSAMFG